MNVDDNLVSGPRILVSLQYNDTEEILTVTIHRAVELPTGKDVLDSVACTPVLIILFHCTYYND